MDYQYNITVLNINWYYEHENHCIIGDFICVSENDILYVQDVVAGMFVQHPDKPHALLCCNVQERRGVVTVAREVYNLSPMLKDYFTEGTRASCYQKTLLVNISGLSGSNARQGRETFINRNLIFSHVILHNVALLSVVYIVYWHRRTVRVSFKHEKMSTLLQHYSLSGMWTLHRRDFTHYMNTWAVYFDNMLPLTCYGTKSTLTS
jgi:hypothetical protein